MVVQAACAGMARLKARTHLEHVLHVRDIGRVEAERLVERRRELPSRKAGVRCGEVVRPGRREGIGWRRRKWHARGGPDSRLWGGRARTERTWNMPCMPVTLDVSQLEMSALKFCKS